MKSWWIQNSSRLFFIMMAQEQTNVEKCYQGTKIPQPSRLNGEGRAQYVCVSMCYNLRCGKDKSKTNICLHLQKIKNY